jgi:hypothetical protein
MDNSFFAYLQQLELMAFFSAYPLVYSVIYVVAGNSQKELPRKLPSLLPYAYALVGTLYLGLQLKNLYPDYSLENIRSTVQQPLLTLWALLSLLFWIPALAKKPVISLLHSFVFFFFLLKDILLTLFSSDTDKNIIKNEMKVYTDSLLLNLGALILVTLFFLLFTRFTRKGSTHM